MKPLQSTNVTTGIWKLSHTETKRAILGTSAGAEFSVLAGRYKTYGRARYRGQHCAGAVLGKIRMQFQRTAFVGDIGNNIVQAGRRNVRRSRAQRLGRAAVSLKSNMGGAERLFAGSIAISFLALAIALSSSFSITWAAPDTAAFSAVPAPSPAQTAGGAHKELAFFTHNYKIRSGGDLAAGPAHTPSTKEICGTTPERLFVHNNISP